jgi:hypothetical protein
MVLFGHGEATVVMVTLVMVLDGGSCSGSPTDGVNYYSAMQRVVGGQQGGAFLNNIIYINASTRTSFAVEATGKVLAWGNMPMGI